MSTQRLLTRLKNQMQILETFVPNLFLHITGNLTSGELIFVDVTSSSFTALWGAFGMPGAIPGVWYIIEVIPQGDSPFSAIEVDDEMITIDSDEVFPEVISPATIYTVEVIETFDSEFTISPVRTSKYTVHYAVRVCLL